jgi:beta-galactosidase GanA
MQDDLPEEAGAAICVTPPQSPVPAWDVTQHSSLQVLTPVAPEPLQVADGRVRRRFIPG